jgi:uncharacterized flavoprotein (TIGR03862 family)
MIDVLVLGAGPAGLFAADRLSRAGLRILVADRMPSPARKFLMAGRGGLNLTHSEDLSKFKARYREAEPILAPMIDAFPPDRLRAWCHDLGIETFVGSSGRVFPKTMKASPLLRALLRRLEDQGAKLRTRMTWTGFADNGASLLQDVEGAIEETSARATLFAFGGASWPRLGSNAAWVPAIEKHGVTVRPFRPANCGFKVSWSTHLTDRFAGSPLKRISLTHAEQIVLGEAVLSQKGLEGGAVYALSAEIRDALERTGRAELRLDLKPQMPLDELTGRLGRGRGKQSQSTFLRKAAGLAPVEVGLLYEHGKLPAEATDLARLIKAVPVTVTAPYAIDRAISSAGGIALDEVDDNLMLRKLPGAFVAGEMLDWEAPTGGYLLQACFSTAFRAAEGITSYLDHQNGKVPA